MAVRKIRDSWWADFTFDHHRYRKRSPQNSRAGAVTYEALLRQKIARGEPLETPQEQKITFEDFAWQWFREYVETNNKFLEQRAKRYVLQASLLPFFGKTQVDQISTRQIERFKASQMEAGASNKTLKNRLTVLNKCLVTAYDWLHLPGRPPKINWPRCVSLRTDHLSAEECELLLSHSDGITRELILTTLRTGMRQGEIKGLQWNCIDWENQSVAVRHSWCERAKALGTPKSNRERHVPLDIDVYEFLHRRKKTTGFVFCHEHGGPFSGPPMNRALEQACRRAGMRRITWHTLRHTFASQLAMKGVPLHIVQTLLGHSSITTTMRYAHVAPSTLRPAIEMLNPKRALAHSFGQPVGNTWLESQIKQAA